MGEWVCFLLVGIVSDLVREWQGDGGSEKLKVKSEFGVLICYRPGLPSLATRIR